MIRGQAVSAGRHVAVAVATLFFISLVTFGATGLRAPNDVARTVLGTEATQPQLDAFIADHGLDRPLLVRYGTWLGAFVRGDFGVSISTNRSVAAEVLPRFVRTLLLALLALFIAVPISLAIGTAMAFREGSVADYTVLSGTVVIAALPEFVLGALLLILLAVWTNLLPTDSSAFQFGSTSAKAEAFVLPAITLAVAISPFMIRMTRAAIGETLGAPYVRAALLRGLSRRVIIRSYVGRNAATVILNAIGLSVVYLLGGVVVIENMFAFPGIGQSLVGAVGSGDTPTLIADTMLLAVMFIVVSLLVDLTSDGLNPRLRSHRS